MLRFCLLILFLVVAVQFGNCEDSTDYDNVRSALGSAKTRLSVSETEKGPELVGSFGRKLNRASVDKVPENFSNDLPESITSKSKVAVNVREGRLLGTVEEGSRGDYISFKGIPYAKPPLGDLRFKDPVPAEHWLGDRDATKHGNVCIQYDFLTTTILGDEDCLYLNVFTTNIKPAKKRAVMVAIHAGAFISSNGDSDFYGPEYLVSKEVILVTLNYRLGALGFLNLYDKVATGNQGLKDVILALQWIRSNIMQFGGDPENITILGSDAGSVLVHLLALTSLAEGLFHKAILQSGVVLNPWSWTERTDSTANAGFQLAARLGKQTSDPKVAFEFLRTIDARVLVEVQETSFYMTNKTRTLSYAFTPSMDSESSNPLFSEPIENLLRRGVKVPLMLGFTKDEGIFFLDSKFVGHLTEDEINKLYAVSKNILSPKVLSEIAAIPMTLEELLSLYLGDKPLSEDILSNLVDLISDSEFIRGIMKVADIQTKLKSNSTYLYQFSYVSEEPLNVRAAVELNIPGVAHAEELSFLFSSNLLDKYGLSPSTPSSNDFKMIESMTSLWTNFAKTGNPTPALTNETPVMWTPLKSGNAFDFLDINLDMQMKAFIKGKERWDWETRKNKLHN